ncbi:ROK family protein [Desemzia sp. RIT804]|uniref:ROK family protein n=1 Tax=Desemzia sp. RIT 804 TaxID=2810209 RepID=UPI00194F0261|nr:ROK family protein [Desemzia sp. RIT 804]MBM6613524.1 ROK family protein [Desemzia sp. RIT 804]
MRSHRPKNIKSHNLNVLRYLLRENRFLSTKKISDISGLSVVSINKLLPELLETGEITIQKNPAITGGRRAAVYEFNPNFNLILVVKFSEIDKEIQGSFHVCNLFGEVIKEKSYQKHELTWEMLKQHLSLFIEKYPMIKWIIFGIPGVEIEGKLKIMDFEPLYLLNLRELIQEEFGVDVWIENDINATTLGYAAQLKLEDEIYVSLYYPESYLLGVGIVYDGKLFRGKHGLSGEIQHLPLQNNQNSLPKAHDNLVKNIQEVLQTVISLYDPTKIVIYTNSSGFSIADLKRIQLELTTIFPYFELADLELGENFQKDYLQGLIHIGIEQSINDIQ